jgi:hypothetical protein
VLNQFTFLMSAVNDRLDAAYSVSGIGPNDAADLRPAEGCKGIGEMLK